MSIITGANLNMKYFVILLFLIGFVGSAFALTDNLFYGTTSFERLPPSLVPNESQTFEIKFQYQDGPYSLSDLEPIIDVSPEGSSSYVHIEIEPIEGVYRNSVVRIHGTITVDSGIPADKIFLTISYVGTNLDDVLLKSGWNDSAIINIRENISGITLDRTILPPLKQQQNGVPADEIKCKDGMYRGFSESNGKAICATGYTLHNLIHRGWAESHTAISSSTVSRPNSIVHDYCPEGTQLVQGGWYSTSTKNPPIEVVSVEEVYDPEYDSQGIEITLNPTNNPETDGKTMIFVFVDCDLAFDYFEVLILPNTLEKRKNFVVHYPSNSDTTMHFDNQDNVPYQIDGTSDNGNNSFTIWISPEDDWFIDEPANTYEGVEYIELSASNPDTGELYDWMNYRLYITHPIAD